VVAEERPETSTDPFDDIDLDSYFQEYLDPGFRSPMGEVTERPSFETFLAKAVTLTDHLLWQLSLSHASEDVAAAAECIIGNLNEDGYLTATLEEMVPASGTGLEDLQAGLALVQEFDPLGVAARDVAECLLIQLRALDADKGLAGQIVREFQQQLQDGNTAEIVKRTGRPLRHIETAIALIKGLDPRPGQRYSSDSARAVEPDVQFVKTPNGFEVVLNEDDLPDLRLNRQYRRLLEKDRSSKEVRNYVKERYNSAIQLLRNIEQRRQTIRNVCESIVRRQTTFLTHGLEHLRPMMIKEVAEEIGVHPSTVSRAVANKYAHTPHGVYELRFFFSEAVQGPAGATVPLLLLKRKVKKMIDEEDATRPLTDDQISKMLRQDGIQVTRRTVAKYREDLNIPSTHRRRRS
jgi:RNA polymerase sigma-54 factor